MINCIAKSSVALSNQSNTMLLYKLQTKKIIPFVSTLYSNYSNQNVVKKVKSLLDSTDNKEIKDVFQNYEILLSQKKPPNLLRLLTKETIVQTTGVIKCKVKRCKLCKLYVEEGDRFITSNGIEWQVKSKVSCNAANIISFVL